MYFVVFVLVLLSGVVFFQISAAYTKTMEREDELHMLKEELVSEKEKQLELEEEKTYIKSDEFIIKKAREEFNLIQDGDIIFIKEEE